MNGSNSKFKRIRIVKKLLRYMPRRASIHRYPILNKFAGIARKRAYLWSFRVSEVVPAFYIGWIITLMPIPSVIQIVIAFFAAVVCHANAMILTCLQLLSNAITFVFLWAITHRVGSFIVNLLGTENLKVVATAEHGAIAHYSERVVRGFATIILGAIVLGSIIGAICSEIYKHFARKYSKKCDLPDGTNG
ncbi:MAG: DUF2062 domain-containing protein [Puniceicoccales bacterium]|jgi:uncharacterized protein (DUF2062 family)|nr:DUF2062 domain-containing protein [Puniceicoccales bacterium]